VQVVSERREPRDDAATHDPEGEEGDRHGPPLPPDQAIGVSWNNQRLSSGRCAQQLKDLIAVFPEL
jgi:hypothetical protein